MPTVEQKLPTLNLYLPRFSLVDLIFTVLLIGLTSTCTTGNGFVTVCGTRTSKPTGDPQDRDATCKHAHRSRAIPTLGI